MSFKKFFIILAILLFLLFILFSYLVAKDHFKQIDFDTTVKLQDHLSRKLDFPFSVLSLFGSAEITLIIWFGLLVVTLVKKYRLASLTLFLFLITGPVELFGKLFVFHPSPPFFFFRGLINFDFPSHFVHSDYSYPSGHMSRVSYLVAFVIFLIYLRGGASSIFRTSLILLLGLFLILMAVSRIYLGEHWLSDVIGGCLFGISLGMLSSLSIPLSKKVNLKPRSPL